MTDGNADAENICMMISAATLCFHAESRQQSLHLGDAGTVQYPRGKAFHSTIDLTPPASDGMILALIMLSDQKPR